MDVEKAIQLDPNYSRSFCYRGYVTWKLNQNNTAMLQKGWDDCTTCITKDPSDIPDAYYIR